MFQITRNNAAIFNVWVEGYGKLTCLTLQQIPKVFEQLLANN
jgi:hypothetical protein